MPIDRWTGKPYLTVCSCGSDLRGEPNYDARGIFLTFTCDKCHDDKMKQFRDDVLTDRNYWHDEPIDEE
jgi:hypothetical protein